MIRIVMVYDPAFNDLPPVVTEYADSEAVAAAHGVLAAMRDAPDVSSVSLQRVTDWFPATWRQMLPGCEVLGEDGGTWVVSRALSPVSPHEVEIYKFGRPDVRYTFSPLYDAPVQARMTHESSMRALLMTELGARLIDDGG
jgi:hypothetical protein